LPSSSLLRGARMSAQTVAIGAAQAGGVEAAGEAPVHTARELEAACAAAHRAGQAAGEAIGRAAAQQRMATTVELLASTGRALADERTALLRATRQDLLRLATAMAERLARRALALDPEAAGRAVADALAHVETAARVVIWLHPEDQARLESQTEKLAARFAADAHLVLRADPDLAPGECRLATEQMEIDATLAGHLERLAEALTDWEQQAGASAGLTAEEAEAASAATGEPETEPVAQDPGKWEPAGSTGVAGKSRTANGVAGRRSATPEEALREVA